METGFVRNNSPTGQSSGSGIGSSSNTRVVNYNQQSNGNGNGNSNMTILGEAMEQAEILRKELHRVHAGLSLLSHSVDRLGDTVTVKWANIDSRTYDFYNTLENDGGGSPFSSPLRIKSNVTGDSAIGVWAGYGARYYTLVIPH